MNTLSRLRMIPPPEGETPRRVQAVRVVIDGRDDAGQTRVVLAPGDRLIVENRTGRTLQVAPVDFFGTAFTRLVLESGESTAPLVVTGLWFQVVLRAHGHRCFPLDVYLAPNGVC